VFTAGVGIGWASAGGAQRGETPRSSDRSPWSKIATEWTIAFSQIGLLMPACPDEFFKGVVDATFGATLSTLQWEQRLDVVSAVVETGVVQQATEPTIQLRQNGLREPSGRTHSKCGEDANTVAQAVNQTVATDNNRFTGPRMPALYAWLPIRAIGGQPSRGARHAMP
jgi:hypothetical protein